MAARSTRSLQYFGISVTLTPAVTGQNLLTLLQAVDPNVPATCRELTVQVQSVGPVDVGDASISSTRRGYELQVGDSKTYRSSAVQDVPIGALYLFSASAAVVNVEGWC